MQSEQMKEDMRLKRNMSKIKHKVTVLSGKGGVGKTSVSVNLAFGLKEKGFKVGILDADVTGPNVAMMMGVEGELLTGDNERLIPVEKDGIKIISMAMLLKTPDTPVVWRGPIKMKAIRQFLADVLWGELDYLVIDLPPGSSDEPLSIGQRIPEMEGAIIVSTPQEVALLDVRKSINFAGMLNLPIIGVVENMSGFVCPHCNEVTNIFKVGGAKKAADELNLKLLATIPIDPSIVTDGDSGTPTILSSSPAAASFRTLVDNVVEFIEKKE
ncbi:MAG: Mrp/NBP35 family ATP-binding protein [Candidatus Heimdallarchaeota archaeon]|nr:Mrp/NBP35 family ATP-binding protein [Candidatus Heimdallarchaeota archaeon]MCK5048088.1 Mrp/NBP35 family ATP-binding protein [Candidatus Heimdallarchaeota archaeon]